MVADFQWSQFKNLVKYLQNTKEHFKKYMQGSFTFSKNIFHTFFIPFQS